MNQKMAKVVFHLPGRFTDSYAERPHLRLFKAIGKTLEKRGVTVDVRRREEALRDPEVSDWSNLLEAENLHIIENGTVTQENALNTTLAYLPPFYHLDPKGVLAKSSAADAEFRADDVDAEKANLFFAGLVEKLVLKRRSRYTPKKEFTEIPEGCIAVFLQGDFPQAQGTAFCDAETMLRTVAQKADGRTVVVKAHPSANIREESELIFKLLQEGLDILPTDANIHDILAACDVTVSFNSAVSIEGFLHNKPAILFGQSDFHHVCHTVETPDQFSAMLPKALASTFDYARFLYWYFNTFCFSLDDDALEEKLMRRFSMSGFDGARLAAQETQETSWAQRIARKKQAADAVQAALLQFPEVQDADIRRVLKFAATSQVYLGRVNGEKVIVKKFAGADATHTVQSLKGELDYLENVFTQETCQANRCLMAWPEEGLVVLSHAPGKRLEEKISESKGASRAKLFRHSADWIETYTRARNRQTAFGPGYWIKELSQKPLDHIDDPEDKTAIDALLSALKRMNDTVKGAPVMQAATHGDFVGINAHFHKGVIYGVDIQGECWMAVAREAARFLVWQQLHDGLNTPETSFGINSPDWKAFLSGNLLQDAEKRTTLPFFIGEQLFNRFVEDYDTPTVQSQGRIAIAAYLAQATIR